MVPINTVFGVITALVMVRREFRGKALLNALIDLPFALSPIIIGLSLILVWGKYGWFGPALEDAGFQVIFAMPGMVLATIFVSLPFVVREVMPVLREVGTDQEEAAFTLGASDWRAFWRVTLPSIRWGVAYGIILTTARSLGEFGAVTIVSGKLTGKTETLTLHVEERIDSFDFVGAYTASLVLALMAIAVLLAMQLFESGRLPAAEVPMAIRVEGLVKRFGTFTALDGVSLNVPDGELTALLGPSGSGKSTLLRIIAGLETPDEGTVWLGDRDVTRVPPQKRGIGFVFQHYAPFKHMTVRDNVAFGLTIRKRPKAEIERRVTELLRLVQIEQFGDRYPAQLSGGQRQRMALARALAVEPEVLLLDEPFGALDARVRKELRAWLRRLHDETHVTTVFVTHDQEEAMDVADTIVVMDNARIEQVGSPARPVRASRQRVRDELRGPGHARGRELGPAARPGHPDRAPEGAVEAMIERVVYLGLRGPGRAGAHRWQPRLGPGAPRAGRGAGAGAGPDRVRPARAGRASSARVDLGRGHGVRLASGQQPGSDPATATPGDRPRGA